MLKIEIPGLPPSVNSAYVNGRKQGVRFKSQAYKDWEKKVDSIMAKIETIPAFFGQLSVEMDFYRPDWLTAKGAVRRVDVGNFTKVLEDSVFKNLGIDDSNVWTLTARKIDANDYYTVIRIYSLLDN